MDKKFREKTIAVVMLICLAALYGCSMPGSNSETTPTLSITQAYQTVNAKLTQAVALTPSPTSSPSRTPTSQVTPTSTVQATASVAPTSSTIVPAGSCDRAAPGIPIDITIPDDTLMNPGQSFTKTWRLQNVGSCTWSMNYSIAFFSGEAMGALTSVPLSQNVAPGQSVEISVDMVAPQATGSYQGNWKLRNASGGWFGIGPNGDAPFWVRIVVGQSALTVTPTTTALLMTATPGMQISGSLRLLASDSLDLDRAIVNPFDDADLIYQLNNGKHQLLAQNNTIIGVFGTSQPTFQDCRNTPNANVLTLENIQVGSYICYRTSLGLPGWAQIVSFNPADSTLNLNIYTWSIP